MMIRELNYSGAPKIFLWLAKSLRSSGHDVTIFTFGDKKPESICEGISYKHRFLKEFHFISNCIYVHRLIKYEKADISISFLLDANIYNLLSCLHTKTKSLVCERNDPFMPHYYKLKLFKPLFSLADAAVFQLPKVASYYSNIKGKVAIIPNPVLQKQICNIPKFEDRDYKIVALGRLKIFQKRNDLLLMAFAEFSKSNPKYTLDIVGDGPDYQKLHKLTNELNIQNKVNFVGKKNNPIDAIKNARIYVLTSDFEGIPNTLIEAMSIGLPCVCTDCSPGGASFLIKNGENGYVVNKGDYKAIADKLSLIASNAVLADKLGNNAKKIRNDFNEEKILKMWNDFLLKIVDISD